MLTHIQPIVETRNELTGKALPSEAIVFSSRLRLARNLCGRRFPDWADVAQREDILTYCEKALAGLPEMSSGLILSIDQLSDLEKQVLMERHLISKELSQRKGGGGVAISRDQSLSIMLNEEDHLRIQLLRRGFLVGDVWEAIDRIDTALEQQLEFAFSAQLGYLTACPSNLGTGLRASVMMHLPGLVIAGHMDKVVRFAGQLNLAVRGLFGEGSEASGSIFQISNQHTLGDSEATIISRLSAVLKSIIEQEVNARLKLLENSSEQLFDKVVRARVILQHARLMSSSEAMNHLSLLRLAADLGLLPQGERTRIDRLFIEVQPGHIQVLARKTLKGSQRDIQRASMLREEFSNLPPPNFDNSRLRA
jgi:protein arginine kinase